jgi:hypothetical protein
LVCRWSRRCHHDVCLGDENPLANWLLLFLRSVGQVPIVQPKLPEILYLTRKVDLKIQIELYRQKMVLAPFGFGELHHILIIQIWKHLQKMTFEEKNKGFCRY